MNSAPPTIDGESSTPVTEEMIPEMMFSAGEEPVGVRVLTYQSSRALKRILNALDEEERLQIQQSSFGKMIEIADKPAFSGRFARYMMSRQLKVKKKHETWFRFAGNPIRFSLREFAIVTGLPCGQYPPKSRLKMKANITEKPHWPDLFGKVDVVTVQSVIKMLKKRTVKDREIRVKYACLAILSSVLLPTNLKMKISREHAEAIKDLGEFFAFPWGRVAFEMLMGSIKEKDEVSLSQNTIAIKGFALALQLVLVEAVPSLTEVVQETCSSSESESDDDGDDVGERSTRKHTLSPGHAMNLDKKENVAVMCILEQDPNNFVDEKTLSWRDEVVDEKVESLVKLITAGHQFRLSMFRGGMTKVEVDRMKMEGKGQGKQRKQRKTKLVESNTEHNLITTIVQETVQGSLGVMESKLNGALKMEEEMKSKLVSLEERIPCLVESGYEKMREQLIESLTMVVKELLKKESNEARTEFPTRQQTDVDNDFAEGEYAATIRDVIDNISQYSTPPKTAGQATDVGGGLVCDTVLQANGSNLMDTAVETYSAHSQTSRRNIEFPATEGDMYMANSLGEQVNVTANVDDVVVTVRGTSNYLRGMQIEGRNDVDQNGSEATSAGGGDQHSEQKSALNEAKTSKNSAHGKPNKDVDTDKTEGIETRFSGPVTENPSFSLGLTQEDADLRMGGESNTDQEISDVYKNVGDRVDITMACRKSKRQRTVPPTLLTDYQCAPILISRVRQNEMRVFANVDQSLILQKFEKIEERLQTHFVLNVAGVAVSSKDIIDIIERKKVQTTRVVDLLMHLLRTVQKKAVPEVGSKKGKILDTRFMTSIGRNHPRFKKSTCKEEYVFSKTLVKSIDTKMGGEEDPMRYYFPFNLGKKNWVGIVVDCETWKIVVLDCNQNHCSEAYMMTELQPLSEMFPYILKQSLHVAGGGAMVPMVIERATGICQNIPVNDTGVMAVVQMGTHAANGIEACWGVSPEVVAEEARAAAVKAYEFHAEL